MHGWLPEAGTDAYAAFERVASSYETSQYVQFQEEELDAKLQSGQPLTADEQQMFTDIHAIKEFLSHWPTQLTDHGLKTMRDSIQPGQVAPVQERSLLYAIQGSQDPQSCDSCH